MTLRNHAEPYVGVRPGFALAISVAITLALHVLAFMLVSKNLPAPTAEPDPAARVPPITVLYLRPPEPEPEPEPEAVALEREPVTPTAKVPPAQRPPASMAAPPAPTSEDWAFAGTYTLKNSKGYRYTWGQQVRSMMGTAVEGPDQGAVRFRVEIAPDGTLAKLETLWSTSPVAERLARQAVRSLPQWPPTPTGRPLIFERTISFTPYASDGPPLFKDDCLPDPPAYNNPFAWDGTSARLQVQATPPEKPDPQALADCLKQLPQDSIEAESAGDRRLMEQGRSSKLGR